ncbi:CU044_5270 family protein [Isoptericola croceus]|uniref:CU044_5270 family protein n=1 Tax=Isoptericola croceus TaxID=3031406 RepID=UPI0023F8ABE6|nr:CU044_5270 family protein [Isoptericola croceus]
MKNLLDDHALRRLTDANPAPDTPLTTDEAARADVMLGHITAREMRMPKATSQRRKLWTRATAVIGAITATVTAGVLATAPASAEHVLLEAATNAAAQPVETGEYWYVHSQIDDPQSAPYEREVWRSPDEFLIRSEESAALRAREEGHDSLDPDLVRVRDVTGAGAGGAATSFGDVAQLTWDELAAMPTEPEALRQQLIDQIAASGHGEDWDLWKQTVALLQESPASPELRRGLWQVLAGVPGVVLLGRDQDAAGRDATAIQADFTDRDLPRYVLLLDPEDGTLLEERTFDLDGGLLFRSTVLDQGARRDAPAPEAPLCGPGSVPEVSC